MNRSTEEIIDLVCGAIMACLVVGGMIYVTGPLANQRTEKLLGTHDCFVQRGCQGMVLENGHLDPEGQACWAACYEEETIVAERMP